MAASASLPRTIPGARAMCYLNGRRFGIVTDFKLSSKNRHRAIVGLDSLIPVELAPVGTSATGSIGVLRITAGGGLEAAGAMSAFETLPREQYCSLTLIDRVTDTVLFHSNTLKFIEQNWNLPAKGIMTGTVAFECLTWYAELGPGDE